jgi:hypothetical protein
MSTAEIAQLEDASRAAMAYVPDTAQDRHFANSLFVASVSWMIGFVVVVSALLFAFS